MASMGQEFGVRRVYEAAPEGRRSVSVRLSDREVQLGAREFALYEKVAERVPGIQSEKEVAADLGMDEARLRRLTTALESAGLLYRQDAVPATLSGVELHTLFNKLLPSWLDEAFSHPFWERMTSGNGSRRMYSGWLIELYHYTRNANRHMPLSCAHAREKAIKNMRAKHYAEEWNHYHYFLKALKALGFSRGEHGQLGAAADVAGAVELHAPGRARRHPRLLDLLGRPRGDDGQPRRLQPVLRKVRQALRAAAGVDRADLRAPRSRRAVPALGSVPRHPQHRQDDPGGARGAGPRVRPPAGRAHLALDGQHREVLRRRVEPDAAAEVQQRCSTRGGPNADATTGFEAHGQGGASGPATSWPSSTWARR